MAGLVSAVIFTRLAGRLDAHVAKVSPRKDSLRGNQMPCGHPMTLRALWNFTARRMEKEPGSFDLTVPLDRNFARRAFGPGTGWNKKAPCRATAVRSSFRALGRGWPR